MNLETKDPKDMEVIIMNKPVLVIMAAGMGSRYGGLKQLDPVDNDGHIIMDFSMYDAKRAGFEKVVFIIKHEIEEEFKSMWENVWKIHGRSICLSEYRQHSGRL
mgnify:CR=1 FL=1